MSYFFNNKLFHYYELTDNNIDSDHIIKLDFIEILNNEKIRFDFSKLQVYAPIHGVLNSTDVETIKIIVDWGDGSIDRLNKPLVSNRSTIGTYRPNQWKVIEHLFNVEKRYEYKTDDIKFLPKIKITAYNSFNDKLIVEIPYKILYKTIYDLGSEMSMFSANTTNTNKVSYTLKLKATDSMFVINTMDWRTIYGDDETVIVEETVSEVFSDEFVNEDLMVWDWKTPPTVIIEDVVGSKSIVCKFTVGDIPVDDWNPQMELLLDIGNIKVTLNKIMDENIEAYKNEYVAIFAKTNNWGEEYIELVKQTETPVFPDDYDFKKGIYKTYLDPLVGINGVKTVSDSHYFSYNIKKNPKELEQQKNEEGEYISLISINDTDINFNYTLPDNGLIVTLTKCELTLNAYKTDKNGNEIQINDVSFVYDFLSPLFDEDNIPLYVKENQTENSKNFTYTIKKRNIPNQIDVDVVETDESGKDIIVTKKENIYYKASIATNDVLGGDDNTTIYDNEENELSDIRISFDDYTIGDFVNYEVGEETVNMIISDIDQLTKNFTIEWKFDKKDDWDLFICSLGQNDRYVLTDIHNHQNDDEFENLDVKKDDANVYTFTKTVNVNNIDDGETDVLISYRVNMSDFYDYREKSIMDTFNLVYPTPIITIDNIQPYYSISYNPTTDVQRLILNSAIIGKPYAENGIEELLKDIALTINSQKKNLTELNYNHLDINFNDKTIEYKLEAANAEDEYNRIGESSIKSLTLNGVSGLEELPTNGIDYLRGNVSMDFNIVGLKELLSWNWVKRNTLHDVYKKYKWVNADGRELYGAENCDGFTLKHDEETTETRYALFEVLPLNRLNEIIRRFVPVLEYVDLSTFEKSTLATAADLFDTVTTNYVRNYDRANDRGNLTIKWTSQETNKVKNMFLTLTKGGEDVSSVDIKNLSSYTFTNLDFGDDYGFYITLNSEYNSSYENKYNEYNENCDIKVLVDPEESIIFDGDPLITETGQLSAYLTWNWSLFHKSCEDVKLYYTDNINKDYVGEYDNVEYQSYAQPPAFKVLYTENNVAKRNVVTYGFKIKSRHFDTHGILADKDGNILNTFKVFVDDTEYSDCKLDNDGNIYRIENDLNKILQNAVVKSVVVDVSEDGETSEVVYKTVYDSDGYFYVHENSITL